LGITGILWDECGIFHHWSGILVTITGLGFAEVWRLDFGVVEKGVENVVEGWVLLWDEVVEKWLLIYKEGFRGGFWGWKGSLECRKDVGGWEGWWF
jgi:hypothetical protein